MAQPAEQPVVAPPLSEAERVAADLRTLADVAASDPALAHQIGRTVEQLYAVLPAGSILTHAAFETALLERGATEVPHEFVEPKWATQAWTLPAGVVRLTVTQLSVPLHEALA